MKKNYYVLLLTAFIALKIQAAVPVGYNSQKVIPGFIKNNGQFIDENRQVRKDILYMYTNRGFKLILRNNGFSYELNTAVPVKSGNYESGYISPPSDDEEDSDGPPERILTSRIDVDFVRPQKEIQVTELEPAPYYFNYYTQSVPVNHVPVFKKICYSNVYRGVDLVFYFREESGGHPALKYDWVIHDGGNAADIALVYRGLKEMKIQPDGSLYLGQEMGYVSEGTPMITGDEAAMMTAVTYQLKGTMLTFGDFKAARGKTVIIDPEISWGLYIGGSKTELPDDIAVDNYDNVYVTGRTASKTLYVKSLPAASNNENIDDDAFLAKFDAENNLLWCTYYGGLGAEKPFSIAIDPKTQEVVMGGKTSSAESIAFNCVNDPVNFKMDGTYGGNFDGFIAKFTKSGEVIRSTYVGGAAFEYILGVTTYLDTDGNVYVLAVGSGEGDNGIVVPTYTGVEQFIYSGGDKDHGDVILLKFNGDLTERIWGTYYGKQLGQERAHEITVDSSGNIYVVGTMSDEFGGLAKGDQIYQSVKGGSGDAHLSRWTQDGKMTWLTYYGGPAYERGRDIKTDRQGNIYIGGKTTAALSYPNAIVSSSDVAKASTTTISDLDGYVAKFNPNGGLIWGSFFGGSSYDDIRGIYVDPTGAPIYVSGYTTSSDLPVTDDAYDKQRSQGDFYFAKLNFNATRVLYCTYFGGSGDEGGLPSEFPDWYNGVIDVSFSSGDIYISSGTTSLCGIDLNCQCSSGCSTGGYGSWDAFIAKFTDPCGNDGDPFEPNDAINPAINKTPNLPYPSEGPITVHGILSQDEGDNLDYYQLTVPGGSDPLTITLLEPEGVDYAVELLNASGISIASGDSGDSIYIPLNSGGTYYIRVAAPLPAPPFIAGCYSLTIKVGTADMDGDGYTIGQNDCDDGNANIHPNVPEICNNVDDNCDGITDEPVLVYKFTDNTSGIPFSVYVNATGGNLKRFNGAGSSTSCPTGFVSKSFTNATIFNTSLPAIEFSVTPAAGFQLEATSVSADLRRSSTGPALVRFAYSTDGGTTWIDQGTNQSLTSAACGIMTTLTWDFADFSTTQSLTFRIYAFNASAPSGIFQVLNVNINGKICSGAGDADSDGYSAPLDCNDGNANIHPNATEVCNGIDDNCDGQTDEGVKSTFYADADNDTYGNPNVTTLACSVPSGYVSNNTDCNDGNANIRPNATETCNNIDDNCNGQVDEGVNATFYADTDADGFGNPNITTQACTQPTGYVTNNFDCDDANVSINPAAFPTKQWDLRYGGTLDEKLYMMYRTADGGYILGGRSKSGLGSDKSEANWDVTNATFDFWVVKTDAAGVKQWDKRFGGTADDGIIALQQTSDGGYILGGYSYSGISGNKTQDCRGLEDYWIVKLDASGNKTWDARFGGSDYDELQFIHQTSDGGYIMGGYSSSPAGGDKTEGTQGDRDYWIIKTDGSGVKQWDKRFGGSGADELYFVKQIADGYMLGGRSKSGISGNKTQANHDVTNVTYDYWIVKTDASGNALFDKSFGGTGDDYLNAMRQTSDGGYILGGYSNSPVSGDKTQANQDATNNTCDYWIVKTNADGIKQWDSRFGGSGDDNLYTLIQTAEGGYLLGGRSKSGMTGDKTQANQDGTNNTSDYWIVKTNGNGTKQWDARYGGTKNDVVTTMQQTSDGGLMIGGYALSGNTGDKTQTNWDATLATQDYWLVKLSVSNGLQLFYADADNDGYGTSTSSILACTAPSGYASNITDCNDGNAAVHPNASDICNGIDDNCSGVIDENAITATIAPGGSVSTCSGISLTLVANTGSGISYQWLKNGANIAGATASSYSTGNAGSYNVTESNSLGCNATSAVTTISIASNPAATITPQGNLNICSTGSVVLQANGGTGLTYQWLKAGINVDGATNQNYTATKAATYKVVVTNSSGCSKTSTGAIVTKSCKEGDVVNEAIAPQLSIYPNPARDKFIIDLVLSEQTNEPATIQIMSMVGQLVYSEKLSVTNGELKKEISPDHSFTDGMYIVKVIVNDKVFSERIVYQK